MTSPNPRGWDPLERRYLRRWITTWVALGAVVVLVTAVFLVLIGNSLVSINSNLATADGAVTDVAGHTKTLPDQIGDVNAELTKIDHALQDLPGDTDQITTNLEERSGEACARSTGRCWIRHPASTTWRTT